VTFSQSGTLIKYRELKCKLVVDKKETFVAEIKENEGFIFKIASVYTNNTDDKNDLVQEIIYQLWKSYDSFNQKSSLSTWMYRVALNVAIYHLKVSKKRVLTVPIDGQVLDYHENDNSKTEEKWQVFRQQIESLNLLDKGIVMLYLDNKSYDEIAEIIGISSSNVGTKLSRIKEKLKTQILKKG
jgi:RNA polymerase sigma-70 factor (ECF subfamily)